MVFMHFILADWLRETDRPVDFETLSEEDLAQTLSVFYPSARTRDGEQYLKSSLMCIRAAIQRHLQGPPHNRNINLVGGSAFSQANSIIKGTIKEMRKEGLDKTTRHSPIHPEDLKQIYTSGALLTTTPTTLQNKVFFEISLHFGRRGREGLRELKTEMIEIQSDPRGQKYATLTCNAHEKNYQGTENHQGKEHIQRMYETKKDSCPVASLQKYLGHLNPDCPWFFQRPKTTNFKGKVIWYMARPMGANAISTFMVRICVAANLKNRYTNHCIRATTVTTLREAGVAPIDIAGVTGHKSLASIDNYSRVTDDCRSAMSKELADICSPTKKSPRRSMQYTKSTTVVCTPAKKEQASNLQEQNVVKSVTVEKTSIEEAQQVAKSILSGAVFHGPVTLNFNFK